MALTCLIGWPLVGFMVGSVTGDPTAWHDDKQIVRLCTRLTWLLVLPCIVRAGVQGPIWLAGNGGALDPKTAVALLGVLKIALGWPLQVAALGAMALVARPQPHTCAEHCLTAGCTYREFSRAVSAYGVSAAVE